MTAAVFATGTFALFTDFANPWIRAGLAILLYGYAWRHLAFDEQMRNWVGLSIVSSLRIALIANIVAGCLCCIGSILIGGAIGWIGAGLSVFMVTTWAWILRTSATRNEP
jgi:hypothetical protein